MKLAPLLLAAGASFGAALPLAAQTDVAGGAPLAWETRYESLSGSFDSVQVVLATDDLALVVGTSQGIYPVRAHDLGTGDLLWQRDVPRPLGTTGSEVEAAISDDGTRLFVAAEIALAGTRVVAFDTASGAELWSLDLPTPVGTEEEPRGIDYHAPTDALYVASRRSTVPLVPPQEIVVRSLAAATGSLLWEREVSGASTRDLAVADAGAFVLARDAGGTRTIGLSLQAGAVLWDDSSPGDAPQLIDAAGPLVVRSSASNPTVAYDAATGTELWSSPATALDLALAADGSRVWLADVSLDDASVQCLDGLDGSQLWQNQQDLGGSESARAIALDAPESRVAIAGRRISGNTTDPVAVVFDAQSGALLADAVVSGNAEEATDITFDPAGTSLVIAGFSETELTQSDLFSARLDSTSGAVAWTREDDLFLGMFGDLRRATLASNGDVLVAGGTTGVGLDQGDVVAFDPESGGLLWDVRIESSAVEELVGSGDTVYALARSSDGFELLAVDVASGGIDWSLEIEAESTPPLQLWQTRRLAHDAAANVLYVTYERSTGSPVPQPMSTLVVEARSALDGAVLWSLDVGTDRSTPSLRLSPDGSTLVVTGREAVGATTSQSFTTAYDAASGTELWDAGFAFFFAETGGPIAIDAASNRVLVAVASNELIDRRAHVVAYDLLSGAEIWNTEVSSVAHVSALELSPDAERLFVTTGRGKLGAFTADSGAPEWSYDVPGPSAVALEVSVDPDGLTVYAGGRRASATSNDLDVAWTEAVDAATGRPLWSTALEGGSAFTSANDLVVDELRSRVLAVGVIQLSAQPSRYEGFAIALERPSLTQSRETLVLAANEEVTLSLRAGPEHAHDFYWLFGSLSGTEPGTAVGAVALPLNIDAFLLATARFANSPTFAGFLGALDGDGLGTATLTLPAGVDASLAGLLLSHAYLGAETLGLPDFASNAVTVELVP